MTREILPIFFKIVDSRVLDSTWSLPALNLIPKNSQQKVLLDHVMLENAKGEPWAGYLIASWILIFWCHFSTPTTFITTQKVATVYWHTSKNA